MFLSLSKLFAILAGIFAVLTYVKYILQIKNGSSDPNPAAVLIWLAEGIINAITYSGTVDSDWQASITYINSTLVFILFFYVFLRRKFTKLGWVEIVSLALAFTIGIFWFTTGDDKLSNGLLQIIYFISFVPIAIGINRNEVKENPVAWNLAGISYIFVILSICFNYNGEIISFAYPVINGLGNFAIVYMIANSKKNISSLIKV